ncbi:hypothetical protein EK21DRAFT_94634 [Setomelanomma holmii]|uniref:Uncharacterized protein n=1 Tax=Setomelanomma holmii TaxID=210430 RepID=A0A9P4LG23_9PLEO|nr:hypothetical protein EK21DRAFT_94634 [Setomelanomma holmii]
MCSRKRRNSNQSHKNKRRGVSPSSLPVNRPCQLLNLPREIRDIIYGYYQGPIDLTRRRSKLKKATCLSLAQTCKQTRSESYPPRNVTILVELSQLKSSAGTLVSKLRQLNTTVTLILRKDRLYNDAEKDAEEGHLGYLCSLIGQGSIEAYFSDNPSLLRVSTAQHSFAMHAYFRTLQTKARSSIVAFAWEEDDQVLSYFGGS